LLIQNKKSFEKLQQVLRVGELGDPREIATKKLIIREGITIPKGTTFCWDEKLLLDYLSTLELKECEPEHIVLSLKLDGNEYKFTYYELLFLISSLNKSQKLELQQNQMRARVELAAMLYFIRYPYENA
jgi:hypothetical protein